MCLTLLDAFLQSHFIYRSRCLGSGINCIFFFFTKILEDEKSTRPNPHWTVDKKIVTGLAGLQSCFLRWKKCSPMDSGIGPACWGCHAKPTWFSSEFYLWGEEKSSGRQSNWASPVRPLPNRPIFNSRADSPPHTTSSNQKSTLFLEEEKKSVLSIINSPLYFCFEKIWRHFAFFRRKLIQSGSLPGASCGYPTSRKEVNCDYFSMGRR